MKGTFFIMLACIGMASSIWMPNQKSYNKECLGRKVYSELDYQWLNAQPCLNFVMYSKNMQYYALSTLLGTAATNSLSEQDAADRCISSVWSGQTGNVGFTNGPKNTGWVVHRSPYQLGTAEVTVKGRYAYSLGVTFSDNECFIIVETYFPDCTRGFHVSLRPGSVLTPKKKDMIKWKLKEMGFTEDEYISVCDQCAK